jgi:hypothetical protein
MIRVERLAYVLTTNPYASSYSWVSHELVRLYCQHLFAMVSRLAECVLEVPMN